MLGFGHEVHVFPPLNGNPVIIFYQGLAEPTKRPWRQQVP